MHWGCFCPGLPPYRLLFQLNTLALTLLPQLGISEKWCRLLPSLLPSDSLFTENQLDTILDRSLPSQGATLLRHIKEALAIATYRTQTTYPVVELLLCDDAPQFDHLTAQSALCWLHEYRHYKKLTPRFVAHLNLLKEFANDFWTLYRRLLAYRDHPSAAEAESIRTAFDHLFGHTSGYQQLDERFAQTLAKKEPLLMVLSHPEILLHNNPAEPAARQRVRKRDVSLPACLHSNSGRGKVFPLQALGHEISHNRRSLRPFLAILAEIVYTVLMLDDDAYLHWLEKSRFSDPARTLLTDIQRSPPVRRTASGRGNIHGRYPSRKMRRTIQFENTDSRHPIHILALKDGKYVHSS